MKGKMKIGIIGTGGIGATLTRYFTRLGHDVVIANSRGPETLAELARETGAKPLKASDVPPGRDLVVVTIPEDKVPELPRGLFKGVPQNQIVIDTGNYYPRERDGKIEGIEDGLPESRWVEQQLGHPVIKVFNNINYEHLANRGKPPGTPVYDGDFDAEGVRRALAQARPERKPEWRATPNSPGTWCTPR